VKRRDDLNLNEIKSILHEAIDSFIVNIGKYNWSLFYESDFRSALYVEFIRTMDRKGKNGYPIRTEHKYGKFQADIALGDKQEVAIELKFAYTSLYLYVNDFKKARVQINGYLQNGAKAAYLVVLDHQIDPTRKPISEIIEIGDIGLQGEWKEIKNSSDEVFDRILVSSLPETS